MGLVVLAEFGGVSLVAGGPALFAGLWLAVGKRKPVSVRERYVVPTARRGDVSSRQVCWAVGETGTYIEG